MILSLYALFIFPSGQVDFWDMPRNLPNVMVELGYHLSPKIVSSVRGFRWKIPISVNLDVSSLPSSAACISAFRVLRTKPSAARWPSCAPSYSPAVRSRRANSLIVPGSRAPVSPISYAPSRPRAGSSASTQRLAGALSVYLFIVSAILCFFVYRMTNDNDPDGSKKAAKKRAKAERRKR